MCGGVHVGVCSCACVCVCVCSCAYTCVALTWVVEVLQAGADLASGLQLQRGSSR